MNFAFQTGLLILGFSSFMPSYCFSFKKVITKNSISHSQTSTKWNYTHTITIVYKQQSQPSTSDSTTNIEHSLFINIAEADQDTIMECDWMRFIQQSSLQSTPLYTRIPLSLLGSPL